MSRDKKPASRVTSRKPKTEPLSNVFLKVTEPVPGLAVGAVYRALSKGGADGCFYVINVQGAKAALYPSKNCLIVKPSPEAVPSAPAQVDKKKLVDDYFVFDKAVREKQLALDAAKEELRSQAKLIAEAFKGQRFVYKGAVWMTVLSSGKKSYTLRCINVPALEVVG